MSIKHVAAAVIAPTAIAGIALSTGATASAAPVHYAAHHAPQHTRHHRQHQQRHPYQWVTVQTGDTLSRIAAVHHISWEALYATFPNYHRVADPNLIRVGQHLRLPKDPALRASQFPALEARLRASVAVQQAPVQASAAPAADQQASDQQPAAAQPAPDQASSDQASTSQASTSQASTGQASTGQASTGQASTGQAQASSQPSSGGSLTSGMSSFEQCVAFRESSDTPTDPDGLFGILPSTWASLGYSGMAGQAPVSVQKQAFSRLYAADGTAPWAPYDGC